MWRTRARDPPHRRCSTEGVIVDSIWFSLFWGEQWKHSSTSRSVLSTWAPPLRHSASTGLLANLTGVRALAGLALKTLASGFIWRVATSCLQQCPLWTQCPSDPGLRLLLLTPATP